MAKQLMKGNEALAEGAIRAGCRFYSGYPITPQTEILEYLSWRMPEVGGKFIQTESEVAGMAMLYGAASGGARGMSSSAGPGFTLCQEGLSYLTSCDLPAVLVHVQRIGSGIGDIAQSQGDYWLMTRGGGNGDYRNIVLAPASVQESVDLISIAFDLSEKYLHPVLIGSDAAIGQMVEPVELPEFQEHDINKFDWTLKGTKRGDEPRTITNVWFTTQPDNQTYLNTKYKEIEDNEQRWESIETEDAQIILVAYGVSARICKEAVRKARKAGLRVGLIRPITLWPYPKKAFENLKDDFIGFIDVEMSVLAQMVDDVKLATDSNYPVEFVGHFQEVPESDDIVAKAKEMIEGK